jgi:arginase
MSNRFAISPFNLDQPLPQLEQLAQPGWYINNATLPDDTAQRRMSILHGFSRDFVTGAVTAGDRPVVIGGDCCTSIGVAAGLQRAGVNPILIWLDAHGDFNTWETTPSGFIGGMPLAMLVGRGEQTMVQAAGLLPLPETDIWLMDARSLDPGEAAALKRSRVHHVPDCDGLLRQLGGDRPLYVHFDTDVVSPDDAPAMTYRTPGGPGAREVEALFRSLAKTGRLAAVSMCSWNPELDEDGRSQATCMALLGALID